MKFYLVPVGQEFNYQGEAYIKTGPLTASPKTGGKDKLIPRSAMTAPVGSHAPSEPDDSDKQYLSKDAVINTINNYHHYCLALLNELDKESSENVRKKLDEYYQELKTTL